MKPQQKNIEKTKRRMIIKSPKMPDTLTSSLDSLEDGKQKFDLKMKM